MVDRALGLELHLVLRERAGLIGTEDSHAGHVLDGGQPRHDRPYRQHIAHFENAYVRFLERPNPNLPTVLG